MTTLNECFADISGTNWEMIRLRISQYEKEGESGLTGAFAAQLIFKNSLDAIKSGSMQAVGLIMSMDGSCIAALEGVKRLFKEYPRIEFRN